MGSPETAGSQGAPAGGAVRSCGERTTKGSQLVYPSQPTTLSQKNSHLVLYCFLRKLLRVPYLMSTSLAIPLRRSSTASILLERGNRGSEWGSVLPEPRPEPVFSLQKSCFSLSTHCEFRQDRNTFLVFESQAQEEFWSMVRAQCLLDKGPVYHVHCRDSFPSTGVHHSLCYGDKEQVCYLP